MDLLIETLAGYDAAPATIAACPYIETSPAFDAWVVGCHIARDGLPRPAEAAKSRGNSVRVDGVIYRIVYREGWPIINRA